PVDVQRASGAEEGVGPAAGGGGRAVPHQRLPIPVVHQAGVGVPGAPLLDVPVVDTDLLVVVDVHPALVGPPLPHRPDGVHGGGDGHAPAQGALAPAAVAFVGGMGDGALDVRLVVLAGAAVGTDQALGSQDVQGLRNPADEVGAGECVVLDDQVVVGPVVMGVPFNPAGCPSLCRVLGPVV